jgi:hypothetical protein
VLIASMNDADREGIDINGKFLDTSIIQNLLRSFAPQIPHFIQKFKDCMRKHRSCEKPSEEKKEEPSKYESVPFFIPEDIVEPPVEKKVEEPLKYSASKKDREECPVATENDEDIHVSLAYELEQLFEVDFFKMLNFVKLYPKLNRE